MKRPAYESAPLPISAPKASYAHDSLVYNNLVPSGNHITMTEALDFLYSKDPATKKIEYVDDRISYLPTNQDNTLYIPVDSAAVAASGIIPAEWNHAIVDKIVPKWGNNKYGLYMTNVVSLDIINTNAQQGWKRPIYFAVTVGSDSYLGLEEYFSRTGLAYQVVPLSNYNNGVNTEKMYDNIMTKFRWGGLDKATPDNPLYLDENTRRMCTTMRMSVSILAKQLIEEGKYDKALNVLNLIMEKMPSWQVPLDATVLDIAQCYLELGEQKKAENILNELLIDSRENMAWYHNLGDKYFYKVTNEYYRHLLQLETICELSLLYSLGDLFEKTEDVLIGIIENSLDIAKSLYSEYEECQREIQHYKKKKQNDKVKQLNGKMALLNGHIEVHSTIVGELYRFAREYGISGMTDKIEALY